MSEQSQDQERPPRRFAMARSFLRFCVGFLATLAVAGAVFLRLPPTYAATAIVLAENRWQGCFPQRTTEDIIRADAMMAAKRLGLFADPEFHGLWPENRASRVEARALQAIGRRLHVQRMTLSVFAEITFEHSSSARASAIANAFAEEHVSRSARDHAQELARARAQLQTFAAQAEAEADAYRAPLRPGEPPNMRLAELEQRARHLRTLLEGLGAPSSELWTPDNTERNWRAAMISRAESPTSPSPRYVHTFALRALAAAMVAGCVFAVAASHRRATPGEP
jgi:hypothetical protein